MAEEQEDLEKPQPPWVAEVAVRLVASRVATGRSQAAVARALEISPQRWNHYEKGRRPLDMEVATAFCDKYRVTLDWLYRGEPDGLPLEMARKLVEPTDLFRARKKLR